MSSGALYDRVRDLEVEIDGFATERREVSVTSGFRRVTTTVLLSGAGETGTGEDVTYDAADHEGFPQLGERGRFTLEGLSRALEAYDLPDYRRWAFESAALDLGLRQARTSLAKAVGAEYRPVRFVVSTRLHIEPWLDEYPRMEFKLDPTSDWTDEQMRDVASTGSVRVLDLKGQYHGTPVDQAPDERLYRSVVEIFPEAVIEDPALTDDTRRALRGAEDRLSWDAPIHSVADIEARAPRFCNMKPSRFGSVQRLFDAIDYCRREGIVMYGGGQFELGRGREQIQKLASLFYADAPNDVAPSVYNEGGPRPGLPVSPLHVLDGEGF